MPDTELHTLDVPPDVSDDGGHEVLRAFVSQGGLSVALRRSFDDPLTWGILLADLARHAARIYASETEYEEADAMQRILQGLSAELDSPTDPGSTSAAH